MTRGEATDTVRRLAAEHPDRATHRWLPRQSQNGEWSVVKVAMPAGVTIDPLKTTVETKPKPPDDPRTAYERNVGGNYIG